MEVLIINIIIFKSDVILVEKWEVSFSMMERRLKQVKEEIDCWREKF